MEVIAFQVLVILNRMLLMVVLINIAIKFQEMDPDLVVRWLGVYLLVAII